MTDGTCVLVYILEDAYSSNRFSCHRALNV